VSPSFPQKKEIKKKGGEQNKNKSSLVFTKK
jgi:hypothetical protein